MATPFNDSLDEKDLTNQSMSKPLSREDQMEVVILAYLRNCPRAADTFDGILGEWINRQQARVDAGMLAKVLDRLTRRHVLERFETGGPPCYRLAKPL